MDRNGGLPPQLGHHPQAEPRSRTKEPRAAATGTYAQHCSFLWMQSVIQNAGSIQHDRYSRFRSEAALQNFIGRL